ncbi:PEPxxWA-CTERM sorting domain-containing protein [Sphingomonas immobilis]|uniref:PEPxxWA-CTERM sorting domain-containing protein n=1 Tax=Sphingomonas immobilis TaxID=3063997 RepID=A0ABT8ZW29_9SPHN|nr:PEPxxWA-CTERM sorting domain-containing protein [Sphingomonas sp. CA1-15]MDO7841778.1 PEPxxWA-CTERM sorting domain-containing protein [Sphingomonas sp. CA1-15]
MALTRLIGAASLLLLISVVPAKAQTTTIGTGNGQGGSLLVARPDLALGQSITSPGQSLQTVSLQVLSGDPASTYSFGVYDYNAATSTIGQQLYLTQFNPLASGTLTLNNINVATTAGDTYAFAITPYSANPGSSTVTFRAINVGNTGEYYSGGSYFNLGSSGNPEGAVVNTFANNYDLQFSAVFAAAIAPEPASWAMMISGFGFIGSAVRRARRKDQALSLA